MNSVEITPSSQYTKWYDLPQAHTPFTPYCAWFYKDKTNIPSCYRATPERVIRLNYILQSIGYITHIAITHYGHISLIYTKEPTELQAENKMSIGMCAKLSVELSLTNIEDLYE